MPRTLLGIAVGAAIGVAGALMQALTRNPLADPGLLGVNAGASAAVVIALSLGLAGAASSIWFAFLGAAVASIVGLRDRRRRAAAARRPSGSRSPAPRSPRR